MKSVVAGGFGVALCAVLLCTALGVGVRGVGAEEGPQAAKPQKEHAWLAQLSGEWTTEMECVVGPDQPPMKATGAESTRMVGGLWSITELKSETMGEPFTGILTLGYDPVKQKFVGTWIDTMTAFMWRYEGSLDEKGTLLTLETEGPSPVDPTSRVAMRDSIEIVGPDHKRLRSAMQGPDGKWVTFMTMDHRRKK